MTEQEKYVSLPPEAEAPSSSRFRFQWHINAGAIPIRETLQNGGAGDGRHAFAEMPDAAQAGKLAMSARASDILRKGEDVERTDLSGFVKAFNSLSTTPPAPAGVKKNSTAVYGLGS